MEGEGSKYNGSENLTMFECENICLLDCDCVAYGYANKMEAAVRFGRGLPVWVQVTIGLSIPAMFLLLCFMSYVKWRTQILKVIRKMKKGFVRGIGAISE
ncbi:hypothetical protein SDJN02_24257, partial [Cucurbita argyrosperma subsp. argyrosperma]